MPIAVVPTLHQGKANSFMKACGFGGVEDSAPPIAAPVEACGPVPGAGYVGVIDVGPVLSPAALPGEAPGSSAWSRVRGGN